MLKPVSLSPVLALTFTTFGFAVAQSAGDKGLVLTLEGKPASTIVIAQDATRSAQFAAYELQWHLREISGAEIPIVREEAEASVKGTRLLVGESAATAALGLKNRDFTPQEYLIRFLPDKLVLMGRDKEDRGVVKYAPTPDPAALETWPGIWDEKGTMHAVYDFLERFCNVRWFNATETGMDCPHRKTVVVAGNEIRRAPFFRYRYAAYPSSENYDAYTGLWPSGSDGFKHWEAAAFPDLQQRFTDRWQYVHAKRGWVQLFRFRMREGGELCPGNHSLYGYYNRFWEKSSDAEVAKQFEGQRRDLFAKGYEGKPPQMCYTSSALVEQVAQDARDFFDGKGARPGAVAAGNFFCVEPMDNDQFCRCAACQALLKPQQEFDPFFSNGRHSDYFFNFVNEVAKEVRKTHPDKWIVCLAYMTHARHPAHVRLEPNVAVQFCFACNRLCFDRASYEHEVDLLNDWAAKERGRPLYLWLYYTFPVEIANNGQFHCFPGFFAHAIGEQFKLFRKCGLRGMFHCGYGQEVEAYLTYRLMDDPALKVDVLLEEYFRRLYGAAAEPMRQLYLAIEKTYSDPLNYQEGVATRKVESHHHQTEEVAWGYLGTEKRMAEFARLLQKAKDLAGNEVEKRRVALFEAGTWDYMVEGRRLYQEHMKARYGEIAPARRIPFTDALQDDPARAGLTESAVLFGWHSRSGGPTRRKLEARLLADRKHLYVQLEEKVDPRTLVGGDDLSKGDYWDVLVSAQRQKPFREIALGAKGNHVSREHGVDDAAPVAWESGAVVASDTSKRDRWTVSVALPLDKLLPKEVRPGDRIYMNFTRRSSMSDDEPVYVPTFGEFNDPGRFREFVLDTPDTIPANLPSEAEMDELNTKGLVGLWRLNEGAGTVVRDSSPNGLKGTLVNGATWMKEKAGPVVHLDDQRGQYVDLGSDPALNLNGPLTLLAWVKYEASETWYPAVFGKGYEQSGAYSLHLRPGLTVWFELDGEEGVRHFYNPTDLSLNPGAWNQVAATYDGAVMRVYINGRESGKGMEVKTAIRRTLEPLRVGWLGSYGFLSGCVRDVAIYSRAMSAMEVYARYRAGTRSTASG